MIAPPCAARAGPHPLSESRALSVSAGRKELGGDAQPSETEVTKHHRHSGGEAMSVHH